MTEEFLLTLASTTDLFDLAVTDDFSWGNAPTPKLIKKRKLVFLLSLRLHPTRLVARKALAVFIDVLFFYSPKQAVS